MASIIDAVDEIKQAENYLVKFAIFAAPVFGCVYKLVALENNGEIVPKIKISENIAKITNPHFKKVYRLFDRESGKALADQICVYDETIDDSKPYKIFDQEATWKTKTIKNFYAKPLLETIFKDGNLVYDLPKINDIQTYCQQQIDTLWDEVKRFENPHKYYVDLSEKLWNIKNQLLKENKQSIC